MVRDRVRNLSSVLLIVFVVLWGTANALTYKKLSLDELVGGADAICIGTCMKKASRFVEHNIQTNVEIAVSEYLKGDLGKTITLTLVGGDISEPLPLSQYVMGTPTFLENEEVLLFLTAPKKSEGNQGAEAKSLALQLASSPGVVGWFQGKYTILTDRVSGEKRVANFNFDNMGVVPTDEVVRKVHRLLESPSRTEGKAGKTQIEKDIEGMLSGSKERALDAEKQSGMISTAKSTEQSTGEVTRSVRSKTVREAQPPDEQRALTLQKLRVQPPEPAKSSSGKQVQQYFENLESLEIFKQKIADAMAKQR